MAINLVTEYQKKLADHFSIGSKTDAYAGKAYEFSGVKEIKIYTIDDITLGTYNRNGDATTGGFRFGKITEVEDTIQTLSMQEEAAFTKSIDKANAGEQYNIKRATQVLQAADRRVIRPTIDKARLAKWAAGNGLTTGNTIQTNATPAALTKANIVEAIFNASAALSDQMVPLDNRVMFISELDYVKFKLADVVMGGAQLNANAVRRGERGTIDNVTVVTVPSNYMPTNTGFIMKYKGATVDPIKLKTLRVQKEPLGINGDVLECYFQYDAFVLDAMCKGVYAYKTA